MNIAEVKPGITLILNGELFLVLEAEHAKLGRGSAFLRAKLKSLNTGKVIERTLRDSDNIEQAFIEKKKVQFLYQDGRFYHFMNLETYEDFFLNKEAIEDVIPWLKENLELEGLFYRDKLINLQLPASLELKVVETEPGFRGNTVKQGTKPAKLETGITIQVPLFIEKGEIIKVNPQTGEYLARA